MIRDSLPGSFQLLIFIRQTKLRQGTSQFRIQNTSSAACVLSGLYNQKHTQCPWCGLIAPHWECPSGKFIQWRCIHRISWSFSTLAGNVDSSGHRDPWVDWDSLLLSSHVGWHTQLLLPHIVTGREKNFLASSRAEPPNQGWLHQVTYFYFPLQRQGDLFQCDSIPCCKIWQNKHLGMTGIKNHAQVFQAKWWNPQGFQQV